jgi:hypothetical protein
MLGDRKHQWGRVTLGVVALFLAGTVAATELMNRQRVSLVLGSVEVPAGCVSVLTGGEVDYFVGNLEGTCPKIAFGTGMIAVRPSPGTSREYPKLTREQLPAGELVYGVRVSGSSRILDASIGRATFSMPLSSESQVDGVIQIIRTFRSGQCGSCSRPIDRRPKRQYP